jgi:hypothetical protein
MCSRENSNVADDTNTVLSLALSELTEYQRQDRILYDELERGLAELRVLLAEQASRQVIAEKLHALCDTEYALLLDCEVFGGIAERLGYDDDLAVIHEREVSRKKDQHDDGRRSEGA